VIHSQTIRLAAKILLKGGLVAFPTETVYGLGGLAMDPGAVRRLFRAKGRPAAHPVIVHSANSEEAFRLCREVPEPARVLAARFWPGPLTLILPKADQVPLEVTGGQDRVGIRVPAHSVALALLYQVGQPLAAPSANRFGKVSPTRADHVRKDLGRRVDLILDGGPCRVGVESTIVAFEDGRARVLRPGGIPVETLEAVLGERIEGLRETGLKVSGALESHYAPRARVLVATSEELRQMESDVRRTVKRVIVLRGAALAPDRLYQSLREADESGAELILAELPREAGMGRAVADRLRKAAGPASRSRI
jgi:L-threonylcarbamoyladenylate synthase